MDSTLVNEPIYFLFSLLAVNTLWTVMILLPAICISHWRRRRQRLRRFLPPLEMQTQHHLHKRPFYHVLCRPALLHALEWLGTRILYPRFTISIPQHTWNPLEIHQLSMHPRSTLCSSLLAVNGIPLLFPAHNFDIWRTVSCKRASLPCLPQSPYRAFCCTLAASASIILMWHYPELTRTKENRQILSWPPNVIRQIGLEFGSTAARQLGGGRYGGFGSLRFARSQWQSSLRISRFGSDFFVLRWSRSQTTTDHHDDGGGDRHTHNAMASMSAKPTMMDKHGMISPCFLELFVEFDSNPCPMRGSNVKWRPRLFA